MHPLLFHFGHIAIPTYGVLSALALLAALAVSLAAAKRRGLPGAKVWNLGLAAILTTLFASRLLFVIGHMSLYRKHPFWVLGLVAFPVSGTRWAEPWWAHWQRRCMRSRKACPLCRQPMPWRRRRRWLSA